MLAGILFGDEGLRSTCSSSALSRPTPGLKENAGKGVALEFRECALECLRVWPVEVEGRCEGIKSNDE